MTPLLTSAVRAAWDDWRCSSAKYVRVGFPGTGGTVWQLLVAAPSRPAWELFASVMVRHRYWFRESAGGTYNCRRTNHNPDLPWSIHAYALAIDLNPSKNPQGTNTTDMPAAFVADLKALRCVNGRPLFRWGGDWKGSISDPMHWQIAAAPADIATGVVNPKGGTVTDHKHEPMPEQLPRSWADGDWERWVARSGTNPETRSHDFYREDLSWVYSRVVLPLENRVKLLEDRLTNLEASQGATTIDALARSEIAKLRNHLRQS